MNRDEMMQFYINHIVKADFNDFTKNVEFALTEWGKFCAEKAYMDLESTCLFDEWWDNFMKDAK